MRTAILMAGAALVAVAGSSAANAVTTIPIDFDGDSGGFFKSVKGGFSYDFTFTLPAAGLLDASLTSSAVTNPIVFSVVTLNGTPLIKELTSNTFNLATSIAALAGTQIFHVEGTASATKSTTFSGTVDYTSPTTSVPEPASWLMMVGGFGMLGFALRRRPQVTFA